LFYPPQLLRRGICCITAFPAGEFSDAVFFPDDLRDQNVTAQKYIREKRTGVKAL
jgi:hypothetical protein